MMRVLVLSALLVGGAGPFCASANELPAAVDRQVGGAKPCIYSCTKCSSSRDTAPQNVHDVAKPHP